MKFNLPRWRINNWIRAQQVRLIDPMGVQLGIRPIQEAFKMAQEHGLDLVEIAPQANPPVCKVIDFAKFKYEQLRKLKETQKKQKGGELREVRFTPTVGTHDLETKVKKIEEFLAENNKVRITVFFSGREIAHKEFGYKIMNMVKERVKEKAKIDREPLFEHKRLIMVLSPAH